MSDIEIGRTESRLNGLLSRVGLAPFTIVLCLTIWVLRRPAQLMRPYLWAEESVVLGAWLEHGWSAAVAPLAGYFAFPSSILITTAAALAPTAMPVLEYMFATAVFLVTVAALVLPDSRWGDVRVRSLFAVAMALVPCNPEVFGVLLYSFWWAGLWPVIVLGWRRPLWAFRVPLLMIGALSSPAGCALALVFALAWLQERTRVLFISTVVLGFGGLAQVVALATSERGGSVAERFALGKVLESAIRSGGFYVSRWTAGAEQADRAWSLFVGLVFVGFVIWAVYAHFRATRDWPVVYLAVSAGLLTVISQLPEPMVSDPLSAGPRYYFHPYTLFAWLLLYLGSASRVETIRRTSAIVVAISLVTLGSAFSRSEDQRSLTVDWRAELKACAETRQNQFQLPIMLDGSRTVWHLDVAPRDCRRMLGRASS